MSPKQFDPPRGVKSWLLVLTLICRDATGLMIKRRLRPLTGAESLALRLHTAKCGPCRKCQKQFAAIDAAAEQLHHREPRQGRRAVALKHETRARIALWLRDRLTR